MDDETRRHYDLEARTFRFAKDVREFVKRLPRTIGNIEDARQLIKASGSVGANYIEANESLGRKDFKFRVKIARKEAKESRYWLLLLDTRGVGQLNAERDSLVQEGTELIKILSAILLNSA